MLHSTSVSSHTRCTSNGTERKILCPKTNRPRSNKNSHYVATRNIRNSETQFKPRLTKTAKDFRLIHQTEGQHPMGAPCTVSPHRYLQRGKTAAEYKGCDKTRSPPKKTNNSSTDHPHFKVNRTKWKTRLSLSSQN